MRGRENSRRERERREYEREREERERERGGERERERGGERERERGGERERERERDKESEIAKPKTKYLNIPLILGISKEQFNSYKVCNKSIYKCLYLCNLCIFILKFNFLFYIF
jgi:hypothetical protein